MACLATTGTRAACRTRRSPIDAPARHDDSGRKRPKIKKGSEFEIKAEMVIKALGFDPEDLPYLFDAKELQVTKCISNIIN